MAAEQGGDRLARLAPRILLFLLLAGLLARVVYLGQAAALPFFHEPVGDSALHLARAKEILAGRWIADRPFFYGGIFYPYLIAASLALFGANLYAIGLAQALAGTALAWVLYRLGRRAVAEPGGRAAGLAAAAMAILYGPFAFFEADLLMISWTLLLVSGAAVCLLGAITSPAPARRCLAAGLMLGLAATERPNLLILIPALAVWTWAVLPRASRIGATAGLAAGAAAVTAAVTLLNFAASGRLVPTTTSAGINFAIGNQPAGRGTFNEPWAAQDPHFTATHPDLEEASLLMARRLSGRELDPVEASSWWFRRGIDHVTAHPAEAAFVTLRKLALFWNAAEIPNHLDFAFMREAAPALRWLPLGFGLVAPLGLYGLVAPQARRLLSRPARLLLLILIVLPMLSVLPFFVADRYRVVVAPPLILASACGLIDLARLIGSASTRRVGCVRLACVALAAAAMAVPLAEFDASRSRWMVAQAYKRQGRLDEAIHWYRRALQVAGGSPNEPLMHNNLGVALAARGDPAAAEQAYRRAIALDASLAYPRRNLGLLLMRQGRAEEAFEPLAFAEQAEPGDVEIARALSVILLSRADLEGARARARKVLAVLPSDPTALQVLHRTGETAP